MMMKKRMWALFIPVWLLTVVAVNQYLFCPQYNFEKSLPFSGSLIYNPYEDDDFSGWYKCNFHAHVRAWHGVFPGTGTPADAWKIYKTLGYDVHCISNYQCVDDYHHGDSNYLEAYEHGYGILKNHQNVLGTKEVIWKDYVLPQTLANKQHILSTLRKNGSAVIVINHPSHHNAYRPDDFTFLSGNDCLELFPSGSLGAWDSALSAGRRVFAVADDDTHDVTNPATVGRNCTWIGVSSLNKKNILEALRSGRSYCMVVPRDENFEKKIERVKQGLPAVKRVGVHDDSLSVIVTHQAAIQFIGQGGKIKSTLEDCTFASYKITPDDTYVRIRIFFHDGTEIDLNPVFRYNGKLPVTPMPAVNEQRTWLYRVAGIFIIALLSSLPLIIYKRRLKRK